MMKLNRKWMLLPLALALCVLCLTASAEPATGACGENVTWALADNGVLTISGSGAMTEFALTPEQSTQVTKVVIESGVTAISDNAFNGYENLTSVSIPASVKSIGASAFNSCTSLGSIALPANLTEIKANTFFQCTSLTSVTLPAKVTAIGEHAFASCTGLTSITLPVSLHSIGDSAFSNCTALEGIVIPNSVSTIGDYAFQGDIGIQEITLPACLTKVNASSFEGCTGLTTVYIPEGVTIIGTKAFKNCTLLSKMDTFAVSFDLADASITCSNRGYTGSAVEPDPVVVLNGVTLVKDLDYTLTYANNIQRGTATVTVTGKGSYTGTISTNFKVVTRELTAANITATNRVYTGSAVNSKVTVTAYGITLVNGTDYTFSCTNNVNVGTATVTVTGKGNYKGTVTKEYKVLPKSLADAVVKSSNRMYTGGERPSEPTVTLGGKTLVSGTDYTVSYENNINAGTATVIVTGTGNYKGTASGTFTIHPRSLDAASVTASNARYTGALIKPSTKVVLSGKTLVRNTDYKITYKNNLDAGVATITAKGIGNYTGTATGTFKIIRFNIGNTEITASNRRYTGKPVKSSLNIIFNGVKLVEGTDYTTAYSNNTEVGTATVVITGIGNFGGSVTKTYQIKK